MSPLVEIHRMTAFVASVFRSALRNPTQSTPTGWNQPFSKTASCTNYPTLSYRCAWRSAKKKIPETASQKSSGRLRNLLKSSWLRVWPMECWPASKNGVYAEKKLFLSSPLHEFVFQIFLVLVSSTHELPMRYDSKHRDSCFLNMLIAPEQCDQSCTLGQ